MTIHRSAGAQAHNEKLIAIEMGEYADNIIKSNPDKLGILLCEGLENSIDIALYSAYYEYLVVIPYNGCADIKRMVPRLRKYSEYPVFGIIDRDELSKRKIKELAQMGIFATKLPFIENIICCPEVLKIVTPKRGLNYSEVIAKVRSNLTSILAERLMHLNPFDVDIPKGQEILYVNITIATKERIVSKRIDLNNVLYTFRDKVIASEVANALGINGREHYYEFIKEQIDSDVRHRLMVVVGRYLPEIKIEEN
ncbi:MAG: hypothetical protein IKK43_02190 [Clostridia bacterium]|nr:hypothetical protein [Clostridia bacterium]